MANVVCKFDTDSKELSVTVDGEKIDNIVCFTVDKYKHEDMYGDERETATVRITAHESGETTEKMQTVTYMSKADLGVKSIGGLYKVNLVELDIADYLKR